MEHEFYNGLSLGLMVIVAVKKFGPALAKYLDEGIDVSQNCDNIICKKLDDIIIFNVSVTYRNLKLNIIKAGMMISST